ncbi:tetratricopeptide repeat protein [Herbaspirillum sp. ST 5-3]|uniref:tetratricopeptide repeat protein n=1 Tax=Oxalobacteraceae TaxID=75682 RepID=UPI0010A2F98B|nr:tetratricopeptide repeat protein [Herbaspirillum sp. ST 5-3]
MLNWIKNFFASSETADTGNVGTNAQAGLQADRVTMAAIAVEVGAVRGSDGIDLDDAVRSCREAIELNPRDAKLLRSLGLILMQHGHQDEAEAYLQRALSLDPTLADAHHALGLILQRRGQPDDSIRHLEMAVEKDPGHAVAHRDLAFSFIQRGLFDNARRTLLTGMARRPDIADLPCFLGNVYNQEGKHGEALAFYRQALSIDPNHLDAHFNSGVALRSLDRHEDALLSFDRILQIKSGHVDAINNRGITLKDLKRPEEALACFDHVLQLKADHVDAIINRGNTLQDMKRYDDALTCYEQALQLKPDYADGWYNCGVALLALKRPDEALANFDRAIHFRPNYAQAYHNRGFALQELKRYDDTLASFAAALRLNPGHPDTRFNEGLCRLLIGDFALGWQQCESRWQSTQLKAAHRKFSQPLWLGEEPVNGRTVLLHSEQGLGDTLQFCRYASLLAAQGATVLLEVQPALTSLLGELDGVHMIYAKGETLPAFDYHCPLLSLPLAFKTRLDTIPASVPYLHCDPDRLAMWRTRLGHGPGPRIGLVWSGNPTHQNDHNRSIPLADFSRIVSCQAQFVCLHKEVRDSDRAFLDQRDDVLFVGDDIDDFADTAALIELMDLVITVDTSVAHLAGGMGKPVWILLPYNPDWRWLLDRSDSPWYPTARLFRQPRPGDWDSVLAALADEISQSILRATINAQAGFSQHAH